MAQSRRSSGSRSRPSGRGAPPPRGNGARRGPPPRGGGGGSGGMVAGVLAIVIIGGIAAFFVLKGDKKKPAPPPPPAAPSLQGPPISARPTGPTEPVRTPPPMPSVSVQEQIKATGPQLEEIAARAEGLYNEAMAARDKGDDKLWQEKLGEARSAANEGLDIYNDVIVPNMTSNADYDEEEATTYWSQKGERWIDGPAKAIRKIQTVLANMKASQRK